MSIANIKKMFRLLSFTCVLNKNMIKCKQEVYVMELGDKMKELRLKKNLKQSELAEKAGISRVSIGNYERGDRVPNVEILLKISEALEVPLAELMDIKKKNLSNIDEESFFKLFNISRKTGTHFSYLTGETTDKNYYRFILKEYLDKIDYNILINSTKKYDEDIQSAIYNFWGDFLSKILGDWYYSETKEIPASEVDYMFLKAEFLECIESLINSIIGLGYDEKSNTVRALDFNDLPDLLNIKTNFLNDFSVLTDNIIIRTLLINEDKLIFEDKITKNINKQK